MVAALLLTTIGMQSVSCKLNIEPRAYLHPDGKTVTVGLSYAIPAGWHIYWRNPGDTGVPTVNKWTVPSGWKQAADEWTTPERIVSSGIVSYGWENKAQQWVTFKTSKQLSNGETFEIKAETSYLICKDSCLPGEGNAAGRVTLMTMPSSIEETLKLPIPILLASATSDGKTYELQAQMPIPAGASMKSAYFFSAEQEVVDHAAEQTWTTKEGDIVVTLPVSPFSTKMASRLSGVLKIMLNDGSSRSYSIARAAVKRRSTE